MWTVKWQKLICEKMRNEADNWKEVIRASDRGRDPPGPPPVFLSMVVLPRA